MTDHRVILVLKDAVRHLHGVRVPPAFMHYDNDSRAVDETEQNHPGIRQRLFQDALRAFAQADARVSQALAEVQRVVALLSPLPAMPAATSTAQEPPKVPCHPKKGKRGQERMMRHVQADPASAVWSARQWETHLGDVKAGTIKGYPFFKKLAAAKHLTKLERLERQHASGLKRRRRAR